MMGFHLGVWYSARAISNQEAAELFRLLSEQRWVPLEQYVSVYSFYNDLTSVFPEIEMTPEEKLEDCPWSCATDHSGLHVLMDIEHEKASVILPLVLGLAQKHGLVCFDPQYHKVYLPPLLQVDVPLMHSVEQIL
jgi:hypothetical protein